MPNTRERTCASRSNRRSCANKIPRTASRAIDGRRHAAPLRPDRPSAPAVLPRTHGSALFNAPGETQALVTVTLGTGARRADHRRAWSGEYREALHVSTQLSLRTPTGETGRFGFTKRRRNSGPWAGWPRRAARWSACCRPPAGLRLFRCASSPRSRNPTVPPRLASCCGGSLALMDAGPCRSKDHVAGNRDGALIKEGNRFAVADRHPGRRGSPRRHGHFKVGGKPRTAYRAADGPEDPSPSTRHHARSRSTRAARGAVCNILAQDEAGDGRARASELSSFAAAHSSRSRSTRTRSATSSAKGRRSDPRHPRRRPAPPSRSRTERHGSSIACVSAPRAGRSGAIKRIKGHHHRPTSKSAKVYEGPVLRLLDFGAIIQLLPGAATGPAAHLADQQ